MAEEIDMVDPERLEGRVLNLRIDRHTGGKFSYVMEFGQNRVDSRTHTDYNSMVTSLARDSMLRQGDSLFIQGSDLGEDRIYQIARLAEVEQVSYRDWAMGNAA